MLEKSGKKKRGEREKGRRGGQQTGCGGWVWGLDNDDNDADDDDDDLCSFNFSFFCPSLFFAEIKRSYEKERGEEIRERRV